MRIVLKNFHIVDAYLDTEGSLVIENGIISSLKLGISKHIKNVSPAAENSAAMIIDGKHFNLGKNIFPLLMPAFVDLHAHFRDGLNGETMPSELLESASLAAVAGGYGTLVCMANTKPPIDNIEKAAAIKKRSDILGLIDLYPVVSLTKNLQGKELSEIVKIPSFGSNETCAYIPLMFSEDGRDISDNAVFLQAMKEAKRTGIPVSCHCDFGGEEAETVKNTGKPRSIYSRIEENNAVSRVIELGKQTGCHIHIAHVSTKEAVEKIRRIKKEMQAGNGNGFRLSCEAMPHNIALTEEDARKLGEESFGRVNPPLRSEEDRKALIEALKDGTIDAIATDHAPHSLADKEKGAPGFSGLETAFAVCHSVLVHNEGMSISFLSRLMSANPANLTGFGGKKDRGSIAPGMRADLVIIDPNAAWIVNPDELKTRGKNTPFTGRKFLGKILTTLHEGRMVFNCRSSL